MRDARAGSVVLTVDPEGDTVTLGLTIEQSDNLIEWTKLEGEITRTIPIPDGKKFLPLCFGKVISFVSITLIEITLNLDLYS